MKKIVLIDGNNLLFRSYYATAYTGNIMRNNEGFPTNALYGFVNMMNKIIHEEKPEYIMVAFDIGKTFRHEKYEDYKGGRRETPEELKVQFPVAKDILTAMGIKYLECAGYEADDIIGTIALWCDNNPEYDALIVSSDKDLLQLISDETTVKLLKPKDYIIMNKNEFIKTYGFEPIKMIDLKALMGDASDNIPGVKGIGEKTAIKLLCEYGSLDNIYDNIDNIKGATKNKLINDKKSAYYSKDLVTIYRDVPLDGITFDSLKYKKTDSDKLKALYSELGFHSLLKKIETPVKEYNDIENIKIISDINDLIINEDTAIYINTTIENYHNAKLLGIALYNKNHSYYIPYESINNLDIFNNSNIKYTYDLKKLLVIFNRYSLNINKINFDTMISAYLLNYNSTDNIDLLANELNYNLSTVDKNEENINKIARVYIERAKFIYDYHDILLNKMKEENVIDLFNNIEMPLVSILADMEMEGIRVNSDVLDKMGQDIKEKMELLTKQIYDCAGCEFNINSSKQLGEILFDKLKLPFAKKNKIGYVTDIDVLKKLKDYPIVSYIIEYRTLSKLYSTYIEGIKSSISNDSKIHTIYTQTLTRTGRLSSIEPNLQNIPTRNEYGKLIRKAFVPEEDSVLLSSDYSQIELRMFAHLSKEEALVESFKNNIDIHTKTAMDIFNVDKENVTPNMRRQAKAVNFGILYGISSFGLAEDLQISFKDAKDFINKYFDTYPGVKDYMNHEIDEAIKNGYVKTIMNRKRYIEELNSTNRNIKAMGERMALNTPIQGSAAEILKKAMINIDKVFKEKNIKSKMLLQVHDELIFNVKNSEKDIVKDIIEKEMKNVTHLDVPLDVAITLGNNWYEL